MDAEQPDYDLDSEDEVFVNKLKKKMDICPLQFEEMIDRLEKGSGQQVQLHCIYKYVFPYIWKQDNVGVRISEQTLESTIMNSHPIAAQY